MRAPATTRGVDDRRIVGVIAMLSSSVKLNGVERKVALFVMTLPYSGAIFIQAFPRECTETFLEGHRRAFEFFGGVPRRISYDNSAIAVIEVLSGRERKLPGLQTSG